MRTIPYDLVLMDLSMPEMDGYSLFQQIQKDESTKMIPFIFLSARGDEERFHGLEIGVDASRHRQHAPVGSLEAVRLDEKGQTAGAANAGYHHGDGRVHAGPEKSSGARGNCVRPGGSQ